MSAVVTLLANLGRFVPDKTRLDQPAFCPTTSDLGVVTLPFVVYGQEHINRIKPAYRVRSDGSLQRDVLPGLPSEALVVGHDPRQHMWLAWTAPSRSTLVGVRESGRTVFDIRVLGPGCARRSADGRITVGSANNQLRRHDALGALLVDHDAIFQRRPFAGPVGVDGVGSHLYLADPHDSHSVWSLDGAGSPIRRFGTRDEQANRTGNGRLYYPMDVVVLSSDQVVVAEGGRDRITVLSSLGHIQGTVTAADLAVDEIDASRVFTDWKRETVLVFARCAKEVHLVAFSVNDFDNDSEPEDNG